MCRMSGVSPKVTPKQSGRHKARRVGSQVSESSIGGPERGEPERGIVVFPSQGLGNSSVSQCSPCHTTKKKRGRPHDVGRNLTDAEFSSEPSPSSRVYSESKKRFKQLLPPLPPAVRSGKHVQVLLPNQRTISILLVAGLGCFEQFMADVETVEKGAEWDTSRKVEWGVNVRLLDLNGNTIADDASLLLAIKGRKPTVLLEVNIFVH